MDKIPLRPVGEWKWRGQMPTQDPAAAAFSPPFFDPKPVMYLGVKRRQGVETFPPLVIHIQILEEEQRYNVSVPAWTGATVNVTVRDTFFGPLMIPAVTLSGTLNKFLECYLFIPPETVKQWFEPQGPLHARVNENLLDFRYEIPSIKREGLPLQGFSINRVYLYRRKTIVFLPGLFASEFAVKVGNNTVAAFPNFFLPPEDRLVGDPITWAMIDMYQFSAMLSGVAGSGEHVGLLECDTKGEPLLRADKPMLLRAGPIPGITVEDFYNQCHAAVHDRPGLSWNFPDGFRLFELQLFCYDWRCDLTQTVKDLIDNQQEPKRCLKYLHEQLKSKPDTDDQVAIMGHSTGGVLIRRLLGEHAASTLISHAFFVDVPFRGAPKGAGGHPYRLRSAWRRFHDPLHQSPEHGEHCGDGAHCLPPGSLRVLSECRDLDPGAPGWVRRPGEGESQPAGFGIGPRHVCASLRGRPSQSL